MALQYSLISYSYGEAIVAYFLVLSEVFWPNSFIQDKGICPSELLAERELSIS